MPTAWIARALVHDRIVAEVRRPGDATITLGDGGDLVVPGLGERATLLASAVVRDVPGLVAMGDGRYVVEAFPHVAIEIERIEVEPNPFRDGLWRAPIQELRYGMLAALGVAALLTVKVAASPAAAADDPHDEIDEESEIVIAMRQSVLVPEPPRAIVVPSLVAAPLEPPKARGPESPDPAQQDGDRGSAIEEVTDKGSETDETPPIIAEPAPSPEPPKPRAKKKRRRKQGAKKGSAEPTDAQIKVLGSLSGPDTIADVLSANDVGMLALLDSRSDVEPFAPLMGTTIDDEVGYGGLAISGTGPSDPEPDVVFDVIEGEAKGEAVGGIPGGVVHTVIGEETPADVPDDGFALIGDQVVPPPQPARDPTPHVGPAKTKGPADIAPAAECDAKPDPKPQIDVVFVVDVSASMGQALAVVSTQLDELDAAVRKYDQHPRWGLVAFVDEVAAPRRFDDVDDLEAAFDEHLMHAATDHQPGGAPNDEPDNDGLDALATAAKQFAWRDADDTLRLIVYVTDARAPGRGTELSGHTVDHGFQRTADALADESIRVASFTAGRGNFGFLGKRAGTDPIPVRTAGTGYALERLVSHRLALDTALADLLSNPVCEQGLLSW